MKGIPWQTCSELSGGIPGRCSPPNPRISSLYRTLLAETKRLDLSSRFEVTLEATHHGPYVSLPTCFVEIGSTEPDWEVPEAGSVWADCLALNLELDDNSSQDEFTIQVVETNSANYSNPISTVSDISASPNGNSTALPSRGVAVIIIGGGHYVPKANDMVSNKQHTLLFKIISKHY